MALFVWIPLIGNVSNIALGFYRIKPPPPLPDVYRAYDPFSPLDNTVPDFRQ